MADRMTYGRILWDSAYRAADATITLSDITEMPGFPKEYAFDWKDWTAFRVETVGPGLPYIVLQRTVSYTVNAFAWMVKDPGGIVGSGTHLLTVIRHTPPATNHVIGTVDLFTLGLSGIRTLSFGGAVAIDPTQFLYVRPSGPGFAAAPWDIQQISAGMRLDFPIGQHVGMNPPAYQRQIRASNNIAVAGSILGRDVVRENKRGMIDLEPVDESWVTASWLPFLDHAERFPFWYQWDPTDHPLDTVFAAADSLPSPENASPPPRMKVSLPWIGLTR